MVSTPVFQPVNSWEDSTAQTISSQTVSSPQAISSQEDSASQAAGASSPQTFSSQAVSSFQAVNADPQVVSTSASKAGRPQEDSANFLGVCTTLPLAPKLGGSPIVLIPPGDLQEATHWKIPTLNGSSIYPVNL